MNFRRASWMALLLPVFATYSSPAAPPRRVPLFVVNTTCTPGPCQAVRILAYPWSHVHSPGGLWKIDLGTITTRTTCLMIPATSMFRMMMWSGVTDTTFWTTRDSMALGTRPPGAEILSATPSTEYFVPQNARAWRVALPADTTDTTTMLMRPMKGRARC
jgi:hypothetical protein